MPFLVAGIPVLDGGVFDFGVLVGDEFHNGGVELIFVAHGGAATFEVADVAAFFGDDEGALELARFGGVDAEVGGEFEGAADALWYVAEGAVGEDGGVEGGVEVVAVGDDGAEVFLDEVGVLLQSFREGAEDDAVLSQLLAEGGGDGDAVENGVDGHARQSFLLFQGNAEFFVGAEEFGVNLVEALELLFGLGGRSSR